MQMYAGKGRWRYILLMVYEKETFGFWLMSFPQKDEQTDFRKWTREVWIRGKGEPSKIMSCPLTQIETIGHRSIREATNESKLAVSKGSLKGQLYSLHHPNS